MPQTEKKYISFGAFCLFSLAIKDRRVYKTLKCRLTEQHPTARHTLARVQRVSIVDKCFRLLDLKNEGSLAHIVCDVTVKGASSLLTVQTHVRKTDTQEACFGHQIIASIHLKLLFASVFTFVTPQIGPINRMHNGKVHHKTGHEGPQRE